MSSPAHRGLLIAIHPAMSHRRHDTIGDQVAGITSMGATGPATGFAKRPADIPRRFLVIDAGLFAQDCAMLHARYGFLEFADPGPDDGPGAQFVHIRAKTRFGCVWGKAGGFSLPPRISSPA